ncbi:TPA: hypothetical protein JAL03_002039 [Corynebacterium striatum]|nr:hypothetical protein [Corynebacterium striatum]HAT6540172.1 hypothetical protein [Corynebacterium striatum]HAT6585172.1 hypothetical protein [Corynebacterium striatum]HAT6617786.1 hypothetical protein [Corynebacterium striatum]
MEPSCNELHHKLTSGGPNRRTPTEEPGRETTSHPIRRDYLDKGIHGWTMFGQQLQRTWDGIKPALQ